MWYWAKRSANFTENSTNNLALHNEKQSSPIGMKNNHLNSTVLFVWQAKRHHVLFTAAQTLTSAAGGRTRWAARQSHL